MSGAKFCDECNERLEKSEESSRLCARCRAWEDVRNFERIFGWASNKSTEDRDCSSSLVMA